MFSRHSVVSMIAGLWLAAVGKAAPAMAPLPSDPLELVTGSTRPVNTRERRDAALRLLDQARRNYALRNGRHAYDLKITFTVNSGGQTAYDGFWQMEEVYDPHLGLRWTAAGPNGYALTRISTTGMVYGEETGNYVPLRLQEARAALFDPIGSVSNTARQRIRTSAATYNGTELSCLLLSNRGNPIRKARGRGWEETEECIDPQSGLLEVHSQVPGRYYAYDYTGGPSLGGHTFPRAVTVTEAGKVVTRISVNSLMEVPSADPSLFVPVERMKSNGRPITLVGAEKISRILPATSASVVCVFGVVTPDGQLVEAHSLQPSDPNSAAALEEVKRMDFSGQSPPGGPLKQHFVFVIDEFVPSH